MKLNKIIALILVLSGLFGFLLLTNPQSLPLPALLVPFLAVGMAMFIVLKLFLTDLLGYSAAKSTVTSLIIATEGVILLLLFSLHQLDWKDAILVITSGIMLTWYFNRMINTNHK